MLDYTFVKDETTGEIFLETNISGKALLTLPQLNKGTAFSLQERKTFGLLGKLPHKIETLEEQVERTYLQYLSYPNQLQQNIYLNNLHDKNQILFYKLLSLNLEKMLPTVYTPIVGHAVKRFSHEYRQSRGLYISHTDIEHLDEILANRSNPNIDLIVVTDGEGVLGIGDQGIGGMDIPIAKLMVYSLCGGIDPLRTLPIFLDVGTNNKELLSDPFYLGCRHERISEKKYDAFIESFVQAIKRNFPNTFLHWEDLGRSNARRVLSKYKNELCTFNDDIQGTGAVTLAALLAACNIADRPLTDQKIVLFGAGTAGTGICDQIVESLMKQGLSAEQAYERFWLIDRQGLLIENDATLTEAQRPYARKISDIASWKLSMPTLSETIHHVKPSILIGCSAQPGAFTKEIITQMAQINLRPIIFPLSNPDEKCEAQPQDILSWTEGKALIATGTAFPAVNYHNSVISIAQCNNALVFPGIGLGITAVNAKRLTSEMICAATEALSKFSLPIKKSATAPLLPTFSKASETAKAIALAVAKTAIKEGVARKNQDKNLKQVIDKIFWQPRYLNFRKPK